MPPKGRRGILLLHGPAWPLQAHATFICWCCYLVVQSCLTLCDPMDCSPPGSSVHGISHARILEWVAISSTRRSSQPRDWTCISCLAGRFFFTTGPPRKPSPTSEHFEIYFSHHLLGGFLVPISEIPRQHILMKCSLQRYIFYSLYALNDVYKKWHLALGDRNAILTNINHVALTWDLPGWKVTRVLWNVMHLSVNKWPCDAFLLLSLAGEASSHICPTRVPLPFLRS